MGGLAIGVGGYVAPTPPAPLRCSGRGQAPRTSGLFINWDWGVLGASQTGRETGWEGGREGGREDGRETGWGG